MARRPGNARLVRPLRPWFDSQVRGEQIFEFEVVDIDGHREVRLSSDRSEQYPAEAWAKDHAALGHKVRWRRIIVLDPWKDLPPR